MKVFRGNYDGRRTAMVAARNQKEAASALGVSMYEFRNFYHQASMDDSTAIAMANPGTVYLRQMDDRTGEWIERGN